jgi:tetratricopeptide (TPR) repeat protein
LILNAILEPGLYDLAVKRLERIRHSRSDTTAGEKMLLGLLAYHDARANVSADVAVGLARRALADGILLKAAKGGGPFIMSTIVLAMADLDEVLGIYDEALDVAHRRGSVFAFAVAKIFRSQMFLYRGELREAEGEGREALEACDGWGLDLAAGYLHGYLADALMEQGKIDAAAAVLARGAYEDDYDTAHAHWFLDSRARFRMVSGDLRQGLEDTFAARRCFEAVGGRNPAFMAWRSQAALTLLRLGEEDQARRLVEEELDLARTRAAPPSARRGSTGSGPRRGRRRRARTPSRSGRGAQGLAGEARARKSPHRARGGTPPRQPSHRRPRAASARRRAGDDVRRSAPRRASRDGAARHRRAASTDCPERRRLADAERTAHRADGGRRSHEP